MLPQDAARVRIERNYIHHNARESFGYGVEIAGSAYAACPATRSTSTGTASPREASRSAVTPCGSTTCSKTRIPTATTRTRRTSTSTAAARTTTAALPGSTTSSSRTRSAASRITAARSGSARCHEQLSHSAACRPEGSSSRTTSLSTNPTRRSSSKASATTPGAETTGSTSPATALTPTTRASSSPATSTARAHRRVRHDRHRLELLARRRTAVGVPPAPENPARGLGFADIDNNGETDVLVRIATGQAATTRAAIDSPTPLTTSPVPNASCASAIRRRQADRHLL